jgi:putative cell wall-binding protein
MRKITSIALLFVVAFTGLFTQNSAVSAAEGQESNQVDELMDISRDFLGIEYEWGGTTPEGFDCSGYLQYIYREVGVYLPRVARNQAKAGIPVSRDDLQPGDILYFERTGHRDNVKITHSGMYISNDEFIHAARSEGVTITNLPESDYWNSRYLGATRVIIDEGTTGQTFMDRLDGRELARISAEVSRGMYPEGFTEEHPSKTVILMPAKAAHFSTKALSDKYDEAPVLFTERGQVSGSVLAEIDRLGAERVILAGNERDFPAGMTEEGIFDGLTAEILADPATAAADVAEESEGLFARVKNALFSFSASVQSLLKV